MKERVLNIIAGIFGLGAVLVIIGLIIGGIVALASYIADEPKRREEDKTMRMVVVQVETKDEKSTGMSCVTLGVLTSCDENHEYTINDFYTSKNVFESVEIGKKYQCERAYVGSEKIIKCEEEE